MSRPSVGRCCWSGRRSRTSWWHGCQTWRRTGKPTVSRCAPPVTYPTSNSTAEARKPVTINTSALAISACAVHKSFGDHVALDGVDLTVTEGTIFALLGPNGAGKTTMVRILSTLIAADADDIQVGGHDVSGDPRAVRALIGVTGQFSAVDNLLTGEENLRLMADLRH